MQSLLFFNKEGDNLNFRWKAGDERWEGDLIFHENSNDTFKTIGIYMFERIPSFEYEAPTVLELEKFQLFNEYKFNFTGNSYQTQSIYKIEPINSDPTFYSKWIYGDDFESKYPIGTQIYFNNPIFEFSNVNRSYSVVQTKKGAILIISNVNNQDFISLYGTQLGLTTSYDNISVSGLNSIGVYNYVDSQLNDNLSSWSEPDFYSKYFNGKKLTVLNTEKNDGVYTVDNIDVFDKTYFRYSFDSNLYTQSQNLAIELILKTDLPIVYKGALNTINNKITFNGEAPISLKPGVEFTLPFSNLNTNAIVVDSVQSFLGNTNLTHYATYSLVMWENRIFECIQDHTWNATSSITPDNTEYWIYTTYIPTTTTLSTESFLSTEVHLTTNKLYFNYSFTESSIVTMASSVEKYTNDFKFYNIDFYYENYKLYADLIYPSIYAEINYYLFTQSSFNYNAVNNNLGIKTTIYEQNVGIRETLVPEVNESICENFSYNIVFTDLDEYGLKIRINGQEYDEQIDFVYVGIQVDLERTIDKTLRNWLSEHFIELISLGIIPTLNYIGNQNSIYYNTVNLKTEYPNVPLQFEVKVGTTADYYIQHSEIIFYDMSNYLEIIINDRNYGVTVSVTNDIPNIPSALSDWIDTYSSELDDYNIYVENTNNLLVFKLKKQNQRLDYSIRIGKSPLPGIDYYKVINKIKGNFGALITSNSIVLSDSATYSFESVPFATGQIVAINNTPYSYDNQEYNILYLGPTDLVLSYQGPFWGTIDLSCSTSPYTNVAFSLGFGATGCLPPLVPTYSIGGNFNLLQFTHSFNLYNYSQNTYITSNYDLNGNSNIKDIIYLSISSNIYVLGDNLTVIDAESVETLNTIILTGSPVNGSMLLRYNTYNNYLYCLTNTNLYVVDPIINSLVYTIVLPSTPNDLNINTLNGDVYITFDTSNLIGIWGFNNFTTTPSYTITASGNPKNIVYNQSENDIYITQNDDVLLRIDGSTRTVYLSYAFIGLEEELFYEPINSSIYVFDSSGVINLNNGITQSISSSTSSFNNLIYSHVNGNIVLSQDDTVSRLSILGAVESSINTPEYGYLAINGYDGDVYLPSLVSSTILVIDGVTTNVIYTQTLGSGVTKLIFDPKRNSMFGIQPTINKLIELAVNLNVQVIQDTTTYSNNFDNKLGTLSPDYIPYTDIWLKTREYLRKPRENYNDEPYVKYLWKWETDEYPQIFLYDFYGDQLPITGSYAYIGEKPLQTITLNKNPNKDITKVSYSEYQQTIFDEILIDINHVDSEDDFSIIPSPLQAFLGFRSDDEGPISSNLLLIKREDIEFTITPTLSNNDSLTIKFIEDTKKGSYGSITLNTNSTSLFTFDSLDVPRGLKPGQLIKIFINDITNNKNKYMSQNNGKMFKIRNVYSRQLIIDFIDDITFDESNIINDYPTVGNTTYMNVKFKVLDKELGKFKVSGQTEIEDIRYKIELSNVGHNIAPDDIYIFKPYDINEQGIDWTYLNRKRKEMMMVRHDIFPYIGSYKSIINAINFFGYNDLELYEYYRNININSDDFYKLFKVEIPDIFDSSVEGWTINDFIKHTMPNENYENTNLFNLTYKITDKEGNNLLAYSLAEIIIKLEGLKYWLEKRIIPITHKILDITGRADFVGETSITHRNYDVTILNIKQSMTPIDFKLNEAYLMPVNSGSTVYTCHIDFFTAISEETPDYFSITIRTYKTYKEWNPFTVYNINDKVFYYDNLYESMISNNKLKNPRKYENAPEWSVDFNYGLGQFVKYNEYIYQYIGTQSSFELYGTESNIITPYYDVITNGANSNWNDNTDWKKISLEPIQYLTEYRTATHSFNFTIDSNIDPFIVIEVTSDNGYGQIYTSKKNYEIRGLNDLFTGYNGDPILPFSPIIQITAPTVPMPPPTIGLA